jgi:hypothetical protein
MNEDRVVKSYYTGIHVAAVRPDVRVVREECRYRDICGSGN